jgi:transmembrane sensor
MQITSEQIDRFLKGTCSDTEAEAIAQYLEEHPAVLQRHLQTDWETADNNALPDGLKDEMYRQISQQAFKARMKLTVKRVLWAAAAAIVSIFVTLGALQKNNSKPPTMALLKGKTTNGEQQQATNWEERTNENANKKTFTLPDGTEVSLYAHSAVRFKRPFGVEDRKVTLRGEASFKVTGNAQLPLIVYAGPVTTTVLGTCFKISEERNSVTVQLYYGKVMVKPSEKKAVYLDPGQQMVYSIPDNKVALSMFDDGHPDSTAREPVVNAGFISFNGTPMPQVLNTLAEHYHVSMQYSEAEIGHIYFTGAVLPSDSLMTILRVMGNMNGLTIRQQNDTIVVEKAKQ